MTREKGPESRGSIVLPEYYWSTVETFTDLLVEDKPLESVFFMGVSLPGRKHTWLDEANTIRSIIKYDDPSAVAPNFPSFQFIKADRNALPNMLGEKYYFFPVVRSIWRVESALPAEGLSDEELDEILHAEYEKMASGKAIANELQSLQLLLELNTAVNYPEYTGEY